MSKESLMLKLNKLKIKMVDYFHLIFKSTHYNYYRIESYKKDESGKIHCDITFDSYSALRQFQDKLRKISLGLGTVVTTTVIAALIINLSTGPVLSSFAASYDFSQGGWLTEDPAALASHALSQSGWTKYSSKEAGIMAGAGQISLASSTNSITQTNNSTTTTGFNLAGVDTDSGKVSVLPVGTVGATSSVQLSVLPGQSGNGVDGSWTILSAKNINVDSNGNGGRVCADGVSYNAVAVSTTTVTLSATPTAGCYAIGDKIMLLNIQGDGVNIDNVGNYEILSIQSISTNIITFTSNKKKYYGNKINGDTNIGTATTNQKLIVQRIPQYSNVTIQSGGSLTANNWNGVNGGALTFFANGAVNVQGGGSITMSGKGYRGGDLTTRQGESYSGLGGGIDGFNNLGGGGSYYKSYIECDEFDCWTVYSYLAGGGSHSNVGEIVGDALYTGGGVYGDDSLTKLYLGSAGGFNSGTPVTSGGNGGGVIYIMADAISLTSSVSANGTTLATGAGGGGGSIYLAGNSLNLAVSSVNVAGGIGDHIKNGSGGSGRVFLKSNNFSGDYDRTSNYTNNLSSNEPNFDWTSVAISGDGSRQIAVAYGSQIYTSSDFGNTWAKRGVNAYWTSVAMSADGSYQTAVTYDDKIYISDDYGNTWTAKGLKNKWSAIAMSADGAKQTAVVNNGQVYISTDFGNTWIAKNSVRNWSSVAMSADGSRQTATALNGQIYISTDYGNTWTAKDSARNWKSVAMSADGSRQTAVVDNGQIYISTDFGNTWTAKGLSGTWRSVDISADGSRQTVVGYGAQMQISTDYGNTWTTKNISYLTSISMTSDGATQVTVGSMFNKNILFSADYGNTWAVKKGGKSWQASAMSANGSYQTAVAANDKVYVSADYGKNWIEKIATNAWSSVAMSADGSRQTATALSSQIYISTDYGNTWTAKDSARNWSSVAMSADGSRQTAVVNGGQIYISTDYGNTWTAKDSARNWSSVAMSADGSRQTATALSSQIYISTDYGNTWTAKDSARNWSSVAMSADGSRQTAVVDNGQIYISTDYGNTWTAKDSARNWKSVAMSADGSRQTALSLSDYGQIFTLNSVIASSLLDILYQTSGIFTSGFINTGQKNNAWGNLGWNATPNGQTIAMKARSCATSDCAGATAWTTCTSIVNGQNLSTGGCVNSGDRYIQYQAAFSSTDETATPILNDVTIGFINFPTAASLISSPYNSSDATNMLSKITWAQGSKPAGTDIKFQIRTAPNSGIVPGTWTSWEGPDGTSDSYFINYDGLDIMPVNFQTGDNDQWFQYKITLISDGVSAPSISAVNMIYVINAAPTVSSVTAEQLTANATTTTPQGDILAPAGSVVINASVVDVDTDQGSYAGGAMRNRVEVSLKYYDSGVWTDIATSAVQGLLSDSVSTHYLDQVSTSTPHTFNLIWNPGDGFNNHENDIDFKIQIVASDKEAANSIGTSSSLIFPVDAKAPTVDTDSDSYNVLKVDARQTGAMAADEVKITFKATDISDTYYRYSLSSSTVNGLLLADGLNIDSGQWILDNGIKSGASTTIKVIASTTAVYIQYKDSLNNFDQNFYDAIIPPRVTSIMVQDVTNTYITPSDVHLYLAWKESVMPVGGVNVGEFKAYHVERAEYATDPGVNFTPLNSDFAPLGISTDRHVNFFTDSNVVKDYHYYYRVYLEDGVGNYSYYTSKSDTNIVMHGVPNGIQDFGEGGGGTSVGVPPVITSVEIIEILTTQAEIVWNTSVLSNSSVEYIATTTVPVLAGFANAPFKGIATMLNDNNGLGKHRVVIDGLDSNTEYYFRVKSTSADGTEGSSLDETYHFTTLDGPKIASSTIIVTGKTNNSMTIVWATDIPANSFVGYSLDPNMISPAPVEVGQDDSETSHSVTLNSLKQGTRYYFYVKSGTGKDNNLGQYYSDMTTSDATPPGNTNINSQVKRTSAVVTWQADEVSRSIFSYGTSTNDYAIGISNDILTTTHLVDLANLKSDTTYYYQLFSVDASGNVSATTTGEFTTEGISLTDVIASTTSETAVKITWSTNENTSSQVEYNSDPAFPTLTSAFEPMYPSDSTKNHEIEISGLVQSTKYYYRVISTTADNYTTQSPLYYFTSGDLIAPVISGVIAINVSSNGATINWQTDETANSIVEWGTSTANYLASTSDDIMTRTHSVNISGLNAFTDYYFRVTSFDTNSNATTSAEYSLKTSNLKITNVFASAATTTTIISWDTDQAATSQVEYTTNANFIGSNFSTDATATTTHIITLSSLSDGTVYYYKVRSVKDGYSQESPVYTFSTTDQTVPVIETSPQVSIITDTTATIFWETNETSDSVVHYGETTGGPYVSENSSRLSTLHFLKLSGLTASTTYYYYAKSQDGGGNLATSSEYSFTTLATQVTHEELVNPGDPTVIQSDTEAIVSIPNTNTTATSKICYSTLVGINMDTCTGLTILTPTRTHSYYLTNLIASTTYYIKTKTIDSEDGNKNFTSNEVSFKTLAIRYTGDDLAEKQNLIDSLELQLLSLQDKAYTEVEMQARIAEINSLSEQLSNATAGMHTDAELQEKINKINELQSQLNLVNSKSGGGALIIDKTDKTAPVISNVKIVEQGDVYAKIVWSTNEESSSMVGYGLSSDYDSAESDYQSYLKRIKNHVIYLKKLSPNTTYHFSAVSADSWGNMSASPDFALTTLAAGEEAKKDVAAEVKKDAENTLTKIQEMINELLSSGKVNPEDIRAAIQKTGEPPMISGAGPEISNVTAKSVTIAWKTNRKSNSIISYYIESMGRDSAEQVGNYSALVTDHTVNISNLAPGRKYVFVAQSVDALGNIGASDQKSFETTGIPFVSEVSMSNITNTSIEISWLSNTETTSELDYGSTPAYGQTAKADSNNSVVNHSLRLSDLKSGQTYHFKAKGASRKGDVISSDDYTFTTLTSFDVLTYSINKITDKSANVTWKTTNESTSEIEYTNITSKVTDSMRSGDFTKDHEIKLVNLFPGTRYTFKIKGKDKHDQATESKGFEFSTLIDTQAPIIEYVQTDMALISKGDQNSVQAVVTWKTNEPSTSEIIYAEGGAKNLPTLDSTDNAASSTGKKVSTEEVSVGNDKFTIAKDGGSLTSKHVLVITDFKPSTVYTFKARSIDEAGNVSYSKDYTVLAPSKEESVLQIIIKTFEDTFGWLKMK